MLKTAAIALEGVRTEAIKIEGKPRALSISDHLAFRIKPFRATKC